MSSLLLLCVGLLCLAVGGGCVAFGLVYGLWDNGVWRLAVLGWAVALATWIALLVAGMSH